MLELIGVLLIIVCALLGITIMVQNPKGGGLSSTFGGGNQVLGVQKTTNFLEKMTWAMAIALLVLVMGTHIIGNPQSESDSVKLNQEMLQDAATQQAPGGLDMIEEGTSTPTPAETPKETTTEVPTTDGGDTE